jgi:separase
VGRFLGHGGAEQFVRTQTLAALPRCAAALLWGCSSGAIDDQGEYGYACTPFEYLKAGACVCKIQVEAPLARC